MSQSRAKPGTKAVVKDQMKDEPLWHKPIFQAQVQMFLEGDRADCKVVCQGYEWEVHSTIIYPRCEYLRKAFGGKFQEGQTRKLNWNSEDPHAVEGLLLYIYTLEYPHWAVFRKLNYVKDCAEVPASTPSQVDGQAPKDLSDAPEATQNIASSSMVREMKLKTVVTGNHYKSAIKFFDIADRFGVTGLRDLCVTKLVHYLEQGVGSKCYLSLLEDSWGLEGERSEVLQDAVIQSIYQNMHLLLVDPEFRPMLERTRDLEHSLLEVQHAELNRIKGPRAR